jgi:flagellar biosynthesis/type III secretory pathway protein FliH
MSAERVIPAGRVEDHRIESFPYFTARFSNPLPEGEDDSDAPLSSALSTPEEDARRLASVDQVIFEKLQQAERDALDTARRGYEEGFASGETEGRQFGESQFRSHMQRLDGHLQELSDSLALNGRVARDELIALALAIGQYLAGRAIEQDGPGIGPMLDAILAAHPFPGESADAAGALTVHLHPRDLESLGAGSQLHPGVTLQADETLSRGSLRVEAATGVLDASLEERQARLMELVQRYREQGAP